MKSNFERRAAKLAGRVANKRNTVRSWLESIGVRTLPTDNDSYILGLAHDELDRPRIEQVWNDNQFLSHCYARVIQWATPEGEQIFGPRSKKALSKKFRKSRPWRKARYKVFKRDGNMCACCGRGPKHGRVMHIDHIKPVHTHWELRLDIKNLQVLCNECNSLKALDETDWR